MADSTVTAQSVSVYNATPTIKVNGQGSDVANAQLLAMEMRESEGGLTSMELRFSNFGTFSRGGAGYVFEDDAVLKLGAEIEVMAGDLTRQISLFTGKISALESHVSAENPPELVVLAEDALQTARMKRRTKVHEDKTLADIVSAVAQTCGLTPQTDGLGANVGTWVQFNESDLAFARRILARYDADLQVVGRELHAAPRAQIQRNQLSLTMHEKLRRARVTADLAQQVTKILVTGWDFQQGQTINGSSDGNAPGPGSGRSGSAILQGAFQERREQLAQVSVRNSNEADALANAEFHQRSRRFVVLHGTAEGNASMRVGSQLTVGGLGPRFDNSYYVVAATHRFDQERGYETDFTAECSFLGGSTP